MMFESGAPRNLIIAYIVTWGIHIGYLLILSSGFRKLAQELREFRSAKEK